jgi:hypothetical protein
VVESEDEAIAALPEVLSYDRRAVRERFQERFTATRMARDHARLYRKFLKMPANSSEERGFGQPEPRSLVAEILVGRPGLRSFCRFNGVIPQTTSREINLAR